MRHNGRQRGFTLLELIIVVGIMGAVLAGVFAAASAVYYHIRLDTASDQLNLSAGNMRTLYGGQNVSYAALNAVRALNATPNAADFTYYTPTMTQQGVFPFDMLSPQPVSGQPIASGTIANDVWNQASASATVQAALAGSAGSPVRFVIRYLSVPAEACADVILRNSLPGRDTGLTQISVGGSVVGSASQTTYQSSAANPMPVTPIAAAAACTGAGPFTIDWYYNLGG